MSHFLALILALSLLAAACAPTPTPSRPPRWRQFSGGPVEDEYRP